MVRRVIGYNNHRGLMSLTWERRAVADDREEGRKKKGPKGGAKHTPGRGHTRKSGPRKKKRFQQKTAKKRKAEQQELRRRWAEWDALPPEVQKFFPEMKPPLPRPTDEE